MYGNCCFGVCCYVCLVLLLFIIGDWINWLDYCLDDVAGVGGGKVNFGWFVRFLWVGYLRVYILNVVFVSCVDCVYYVLLAFVLLSLTCDGFDWCCFCLDLLLVSLVGWF